jgi:osmoprotectant transport system ATP-binding protein
MLELREVISFDEVSFRRSPEAVREGSDMGGSRSGLPILSTVSFTVERGETVALVGRSGAGKSTVLKLIIRLLEPTSGHIEVDGKHTREWNRFELRRTTGYVLQDVGLFPHMTVAQNIGVVPTLQKWPRERIDSRVRELLTLVALDADEYADRMPDALSGGQRQRVGVARALAADPPVLLMDEPFGALDPITRVELHREFRRIQAAVGKTVLVVTHDMREAFALASRVGVLEAGRLIAYDTPDALRASSDAVVRLLLDSMVGA